MTNLVTNLWGWFFVLGSVGVFYLLLPTERRNSWIVLSGVIVIVAHVQLSLFNVLFGPFVFAKYDAWGFHLFAQKFAGDESQVVWAIGTPMYKSFLLLLYDWMGKSLWLGQSVSVFLFSASAGVLVRLFCRFDVNNTVIISAALLVYGLLPSGLLYGSITLREPWMTLFFMLGVYFAVSSERQETQKSVVMSISAACFCWLAMGLLHQVVMVYGFILSVALACLYVFRVQYRDFWMQSGQKKRRPVYRLGVSIAVLVLLVMGFSAIVFFVLPSTGADNYFAMVFESIPRSIELYRGAGESSKPITAYASTFGFSGWTETVVSLIRSYGYYLGWPVFGNYELLSTWVLIPGALLRIVGILLLPFVWKRKSMLLLLVAYCSMTLMWNIGTTNHGQALRHHMMTNWIMVMVVGIFLQALFNKMTKNTSPSPKEEPPQ